MATQHPPNTTPSLLRTYDRAHTGRVLQHRFKRGVPYENCEKSHGEADGDDNDDDDDDDVDLHHKFDDVDATSGANDENQEAETMVQNAITAPKSPKPLVELPHETEGD